MKATSDMTKVQILRIIRGKLSKLKPHWQADVMQSLKYQKKTELIRKANNMKVEVDRDGFDIMWRGK